MINYHLAKDIFWIRVFGYGIVLKRTPPLFSERYGYVKSLKLLFGWRMLFLSKKHL